MMRKPFALLMITLLAFAIVPMPVIAGGGPNVDVQMPAISPPDPAQSSDDHTIIPTVVKNVNGRGVLYFLTSGSSCSTGGGIFVFDNRSL
jgi:hypothetical protein